MAIFHFNFDLELFQLVDHGYISQFHWVMFARIIAASFLILVGFSLMLSSVNGMNWPSFWVRQLKVTVAALIITIATFYAIPSGYIFFGILHQIALASLLGLLFLRLPWGVVVAFALFFLLARDQMRSELFNAPWWWWSGLSQSVPPTSDYEPVFPWFGWVLVGIAMAKICINRNWLSRLADVKFEHPKTLAPLAKFMQLLGRNSLVFYLVHQPIMIGLLYVYLQITA